MLFKNIKMLDENFEVRENMFLATEGEFISYIGDTEPAGDYGEVFDGKGRFLMPAFYNTHCHVPMTLLRGYGEGLPLQRWLNERIFPFEARFSPEAKYWGAKLGAIELMKSGCVSISDMYFDLVDYGKALYEAGMKANLCNGVVSFDDSASYYEDRAYSDTLRLMEWTESLEDDRIRADASAHSEYANKERPLKEVADFAAEKGLIIQIHTSETKEEHEECKGRHDGLTPVQYFERCGLFNSPVIAAHCVWLEDSDIDCMKEAGAYVSHNPSSNLKLGSGIAPIKKYYDAGLKLTIGTDGASSNNNLNMLEEINLAAMLCRGSAMDANAIPAVDILKMATVNGARAQGRNDCGLLKEGFRADMIMFDLDRPHLTPDYDTVANIVFAAQSTDICMTVCDGQIICKDGESLLIDEEETRAKAIESFNKVCAQL
ncbi:MAG: amidohydrolase [Bacillota bacterium]|nr:amidohydrolase [Bacillota bacterium]